MKNFIRTLLASFSLLISAHLFAQTNSSVAIGDDQPKDNAVLYLFSPNQNQGLVIPVANRNSIATPGKGMIVFDQTDNNIFYHNGAQWLPVGQGGANNSNLQLELNGNNLRLFDGQTVLDTSPLSSTAPSSNQFFQWNGSAWIAVSLSGDVTSVAGVVTIQNGAVTTSKIGDNQVTDSKISAVSASKVTGITNNVVPRSNGSALVDGTIVDDGEHLGIGVNPSLNSKVHIETNVDTRGLQTLNTTATNAVNFGVYATASNSTFNNVGVRGTGTASGAMSLGVWGVAENGIAGNVGVQGESIAPNNASTSSGVRGFAQNGSEAYGIEGGAFSADINYGGYFSAGNQGGTIPSRNYGVYGITEQGIGTMGIENWGGYFSAESNGGTTNIGVYGRAINGLTNWAGFLDGNTAITGGLALGSANNFGTAGQALVSNGPGVAPSWQALTGGGGLPSTLNSGNIFVGNASNQATAVAMSGDATMNSSGAVTISNDAIGSAEITDGSISTNDIGNSQITNAKINDVSATKIWGITNTYVPRGTVAGLVPGSIRDSGFVIGIGEAPDPGVKVSISTEGESNALRVNSEIPTAAWNGGIAVKTSGGALGNSGLYSRATSTGSGHAYGVEGYAIAPSSTAGMNAVGVTGSSNGGQWGYGIIGAAIGGFSENTGVNGTAEGGAVNYGIYGTAKNGTLLSHGVRGLVANSVAGSTNYGGHFSVTSSGSANYGVYGSAWGATTNWAGFFDGNTAITGALATGTTNDFGTAGQVLTSNGPGSAPSWSNIAGGGLSTTLEAGKFYVGNAANVATALNMSGHLTLFSNGSVAINDNTITTSKIVDGTIGAVDLNPMGATNGQVLKYNGTNWAPATDNTGGGAVTLNSSQILVGDASNNAVAVNMSGDATINNAGAVMITNDAIGSAEIIDGSISTNDIGNNQVTNAKINSVDAAKVNGITLNVIPRSDGASLVEGSIVDDGTGVSISNPVHLGGALALGGPANWGTTGQVLTSNGAGSAPFWSNIVGGGLSTTLSSGRIYVGNVTDQATAVDMSGDATISNAGVVTIANDAIGSAEIIDGSILNADLSPNSVTFSNLADNSVNTLKIIDNSVSTDDIVDGAITSAKIGDGDVLNIDLSDNSVTSNKIVDATILAADINSMGATTGQILKYNGTNWAPAADNTGGSTALNHGQVFVGDPSNNPVGISLSSGQVLVGNALSRATATTISGDATLSNAGVLTIGNNAINSAKIADGTILNADLSGNSVASGNVVDGAIMTVDLADGSVISTKIADGTISTADIGDLQVTDQKISSVGASKITGITALNVPRSSGTSLINGSIFDDGLQLGIGVMPVVASKLHLQTNANPSGITIVNNGNYPSTNLGLAVTSENSTVHSMGISSTAIAVGALSTGVSGEASGTGTFHYGVVGRATGSGINAGVFGIANGGTSNFAIQGFAPTGGDSWAGFFEGNVKLQNGLALGVTGEFGTVGQVLTSNGPNVAPSWTNVAGGLSSTLNSGRIYVGNGTNQATAVDMSGDATISNDGAVTISNNAVTSAKIVDGTIATVDIANDAITSFKIADLTIETTDLADNSINSSKIIDGSIANPDILDQAVNSVKIADGSILAVDLNSMGATNGQVLKFNGTSWAPAADNTGGGAVALNSSQILVGDASNNAVAVNMSGDATISNTGTITIANDAIGSAEISDGSVTSADISNSTITGADLAGNIDINTSGAISTADLDINSIDYTWPSAQGAINTYLKNDGAGNLSWATVAGGGGSFSTADVVPRGDGSGMVDSQIKDNGTSLSFGSAPLSANIFHHTIHDAQRITMQLNNDYAGAVTKVGITYYDDNLAATGSQFFSDINVLSNSASGSVFGSRYKLESQNAGNTTGHVVGAQFNITGAAATGTPFVTSNLVGSQVNISNNGGDGGVYGYDVTINKLESDYGLGYLLRAKYGSQQYTGSWNTGLSRFGLHISNETFNYLSGNTKIGGAGPTSATPSTFPSAKLHVVHTNTTNGGGLGAMGIRIEDGSGESNAWGIYKRSDNHNLVLGIGGWSSSWPSTGVTTRGTFRFTDGVYTNSSDRRLKKNIEEMPSVLGGVLKLRPSLYHFNEQSDFDRKLIGFIAQEVNEQFPLAVDYDKVNDVYSLAYSNFSVIAIKAIQEQQEMIEQQQKLIAELQEKVKQFENQSSDLESLRAEMAQIRALLSQKSDIRASNNGN